MSGKESVNANQLITDFITNRVGHPKYETGMMGITIYQYFSTQLIFLKIKNCGLHILVV